MDRTDAIEMDLTELSPATLAAARAPRRYPAVTLTLPTYRREPDNAGDPVRLRNLVAEARRQLEQDPRVAREDRVDVAARLERAAAGVDLVHALDGLVVFAAPGEQHTVRLTHRIPERLVVADTFLTRNLVAESAADRPFWVVAVSAERATLWSGRSEELHEASAVGFPAEVEREDWDPERQERVGNVPGTFRSEETRRFMRRVDTELAALERADPRPLYLVGSAEALTLLEETAGPAGAAARADARIARASLVDGPAAALRAAVSQAVRDHADRRAADALERLVRARGGNALAAGVDEVRQVVDQGRAALVVVEESYGGPVAGAPGAAADGQAGGGAARGAGDDVVDVIVERALDTGADVRFVPDGSLADQTRIAAAVRY